MDKLRLEQVVKRYDDYAWELRIDLAVRDGEILTLLGPSGCGKTTTLRIIAGFVHVDRGEVWLDNTLITGLPPAKRNMGVVFQDYALFPHLDVFHNIAFGMRMKKTYTRPQIRQRVEELLALVGLEGYEQRHVDQLSGGEQQRIALLRALAPHPNLLLLDEPLSALDFQLRKRLRQEIKNIQRKLGITMLYVTHDQEEAMSISDRIVVMRNGAVEQIGTPVEIYQRPRTSYVARFVGTSNLITGTITRIDDHDLEIAAPSQTFWLPAQSGYVIGESITFFFRPEDGYLTEKPQEINHIRGTLIAHEYLGAEILTSIQDAAQHVYIVSNYIKNETFINHEGQSVYLNFPPSACKIVQTSEGEV